MPTQRLEAGPRHTGELTVDQRRGLNTLIELLDNARKKAAEKERDTRANQVFFISGARGSGKTTLLLSLRKATEKEKPSAYKSPEVGSSAPKAELEPLKQCLIWLDTIDLDPMPKSVNLLLSVLARVEQKFDELAGGSGRISKGLYDPQEDYDRIRSELRDLQHSVVAAWDMDAFGRGEGVDLRSLAASASEAEMARLRLNSRLANLLQGIGELIQKQCNTMKPALFILPVDDFDLDPLRFVDLLRMMRSLSVPNLVMIFTGDFDLALEMRYYQSCGELERLKGGKLNRKMEAQMQARASELASSVLRKLIPPAHRVYLEKLSQTDINGIKVSGEKTLEAVLTGATLKINQPSASALGAQNIWALLQLKFEPENSELQSENSKDKKDNPREFYQARDILDATPRHLVDLAAALGQLKTTNSADIDFENLVGELVHLLYMELQEDPAVDFETAMAVTRSFWKDNARFVMTGSHFRRSMELSNAMDFKSRGGENAPSSPNSPYLSARACLREHIEVHAERKVGPEDKRKTGWALLGKRAAGYVMLAHDLMYMNDPDRILGGIEQDPEEALAQMIWPSNAEGNPPPPLVIPWRHPFTGSFLEFQAFNNVWRRGLDTCLRALREPAAGDISEHTLSQRLAAIWIYAGLKALGFKVEKLGTTSEFGLCLEKDKGTWKREGSPRWEALEKGISELIIDCNKRRGRNQDDHRALLMERWFVDLLLLLSPESGVPWQVAEQAEDQRDKLFPDANNSDLRQMIARVKPTYDHAHKANEDRIRRFETPGSMLQSGGAQVAFGDTKIGKLLSAPKPQEVNIHDLIT